MRPAVGERILQAEDWPRLRCFSESEVAAACQDGAWHNLDAGSVYLLDQFAGYMIKDSRLIKEVRFSPARTKTGIPTATWNTPDTKAHSDDSMHYQGRAFDLMFPKNALATAWLTATRFPKWGGIGVYPFWKPDPGLHLDTRWFGDPEQGAGFVVTWHVDQMGRYWYLNDEDDIHQFLTTVREAP